MFQKLSYSQITDLSNWSDSQYHVSPSAIIHRPFNLLEWTSRYGITYSFSPNFLIAQLCRDQTVAATPAGALDLSALVAFISGGEAVPLKTAIEFANLLERFGAPRNALRAGFGMSETGVRIPITSSVLALTGTFLHFIGWLHIRH